MLTFLIVDGGQMDHISSKQRGASNLARKPNYRFERSERQRTKAQKKAAKLEKRAERRSSTNDEGQNGTGATFDQADAPDGITDTDQG